MFGRSGRGGESTSRSCRSDRSGGAFRAAFFYPCRLRCHVTGLHSARAGIAPSKPSRSFPGPAGVGSSRNTIDIDTLNLRQ